MGRAEGVERSGQIHPLADRLQSAGRAASTSSQKRELFTKRGVQTLDISCVQNLTARCAPPQGRQQPCAAMNKPMNGSTHGTAGILLDELSDGQRRPRYEAWASARARLPRPKGVAHHINVGTQTIADKQQRANLGAAGHDGDQTADPVAVAGEADCSAEPEPGRDHQGHRHPDHPLLGRNPDRVGLPLNQVAIKDDQLVMHRFCIPSARLHPFPHRLSLEAVGGVYRRDGAAVVDQGAHTRDRLRICAPPVAGRRSPSAKGLLADLAPIALTLLTVDAHGALPNLPSCRTVHSRAECRQRIQGSPPFGFVSYEECARIRSFFQVQAPTTVERTPTSQSDKTKKPTLVMA